MFLYLTITLVAFVFTFLVTPLVISFATRYTCIDYPDARRSHDIPTPRWGGISFFIVIAAGAFFVADETKYAAYLGAAFLLFSVGVVDDWKSLGWKSKLAAILASSVIFTYAGESIHYVGRYGIVKIVRLDSFSELFTIICIIGVTNAMNLIDGLNGLAAGISLLGFLFIGIAAALKGNYPLALISFAFVGSLAGFLRYNFPRARIFMGDSGSLFLGFSLAAFSILLTQDPRYPVEPMFPVLVLLIPIFDTLRVMTLRFFLIKNPFHADLNHLHHLAILKRFSHAQATLLFWALTALFGTIALIFLLLGKSSLPYLVIVLAASFLLSVFANSLVIDR